MLTGTIGAAALARQLDAIPSDLVVGVNFLIPFLDRGALEAAAERSALVEFFWATPDAELVEVVHRGGARAGWQVGSVREACEARDAGCDVIAVQGVEAGGHVRGTVGLVPLLSEVRAVIDLPLVGAGGIGTAAAMAGVLAAGADAVRIGTRFVAAQESIAHPSYVDALIAASADDTVVTTAFGEGWPDAPHRVLKSCIDAGNALGSAQMWSPEWPSKDYQGAPLARPLYAGQSVGGVHSRQPAADIVKELVEGAEAILTSGLS
jgi:NAD(P)H-dependent flavin oxidoreductase YrpB (nitropropane dioxygenase family)